MLRWHGNVKNMKERDEWEKIKTKLTNITCACVGYVHRTTKKWNGKRKTLIWSTAFALLLCRGLCDACVCRMFAGTVFHEWVINYPIMWWITWVIFLLIDCSLEKKKWLMVTFPFLLSFGAAQFFRPWLPGDEWSCDALPMHTHKRIRWRMYQS